MLRGPCITHRRFISYTSRLTSEEIVHPKSRAHRHRASERLHLQKSHGDSDDPESFTPMSQSKSTDAVMYLDININ